LFNKGFSSFLEQLNDVVVHILLELLVNVVKGSLDYLLGLGNSDLRELDASLRFDHLD
jgi:hypothetical protein